MTLMPTSNASMPDAGPNIDDILARVRAEIAADAVDRETGSAAIRGRRAGAVPLLAEDDVAALPAGSGLTVDAFEPLDEETFLRTAYRLLLDRDVDASGRIHYLPALRDGRSTIVGILGALRWSAEGRARGVEVGGLKAAYFLDRVTRTPVVGRVVGPVLRVVRAARTMRRLHRRIAAADLRQRQTIQAANGSLMSIRAGLAQVDAEAARVEAVAEEARETARRSMDSAEAALRELASGRRIVAEAASALGRTIAQARSAQPASGDPPAALDGIDDHMLDSLYVAFEDRFRGSKADISSQIERYVEMVRTTGPVAEGGVVLDIGCGRGEWLALLKAGGIAARGVDLNEAMVRHSRDEGFDVVEGDAIAYLEGSPGASLAAVTGFHIVEHLPFKVLVGLLNECYRALSPGGIVLFETPNPENLVVGACTFHYDPTHTRPLPPDLLRFLAETRGYVDVRIVRSDEDCRLDQPESGFAPLEINDWFRQPPNYALYARKPSLAEAGAGAA